MIIGVYLSNSSDLKKKIEFGQNTTWKVLLIWTKAVYHTSTNYLFTGSTKYFLTRNNIFISYVNQSIYFSNVQFSSNLLIINIIKM